MIARSTIRWVSVLVALLLAGAASLWVCRAPLLSAAGGWLNSGAPLQRVDYLLIMPGDQATRPFAAAAMVRRGVAGAVLIPCNVISPTVEDGITPPTDEIIRRVLTLRGVPPERIVVLEQHRTDSSWGDVQALADFLAEHPGATAAVVTNDYHARRTQWTVRRVLGRSTTVLVFGVPADGFGPDDWWRYRDGLRMYLGEYGKLLVYWIVYGGPVVWIGLVAAGVGGAVIVGWMRRRKAGRSVNRWVGESVNR